MSDTSIRGIINQIQEVRDEAAKKDERPRQCPAAHFGTGGRIVFCIDHEGHEGQHKGVRKKWD